MDKRHQRDFMGSPFSTVWYGMAGSACLEQIDRQQQQQGQADAAHHRPQLK